jgi:hypothetical protein
MSNSLRLIIFGRQGAGKGTQCVRLAAHFGIPHISTGDMLRASAASGSEFGQRVKAIMDGGGLVSDEVMEGVVAERLAAPDAAGGFFSMGIPGRLGRLHFSTICCPHSVSASRSTSKFLNQLCSTESPSVVCVNVAEPPIPSVSHRQSRMSARNAVERCINGEMTAQTPCANALRSTKARLSHCSPGFLSVEYL